MGIEYCLHLVTGLLLVLPLLMISCASTPDVTVPRFEADRFRISEGPVLPRGRAGHLAAVVNNELIVGGGSGWINNRTTKVWLDDVVQLKNGGWQPALTLPHPLACAAWAQDDRGLYVAGGDSGKGRRPDVYHLFLADELQCQPLTPLPEPLSLGAAACASGRLYVACGETAGGFSAQLWSLETGRTGAAWKRQADLPGPPRTLPAMMSAGRFLYVLGGVGAWAPLMPLADCYRFDTLTNSWERLPDLPWRGYGWSAAPVDDRRALLVGRADGAIHPDIWLLNLSDMSTQKLGNAVIQTTMGALVRIRDGEWWLIGGEPDANRNRTRRVTVIRAGDGAS